MFAFDNQALDLPDFDIEDDEIDGPAFAPQDEGPKNKQEF